MYVRYTYIEMDSIVAVEIFVLLLKIHYYNLAFSIGS